MLSAGRCRRGGAVLMPPGRCVGLRPGMGRVARRAPALCSGSVSPVRETFGRRGGMAAASAFPALAACSSRFSHSAPPTGKESPGHETKDGPGRKKALAGREAVRLCRCPAGSVPPWRCRAHASGPLFGPASGRGPCSPVIAVSSGLSVAHRNRKLPDSLTPLHRQAQKRELPRLCGNIISAPVPRFFCKKLVVRT